MSPQLEHMRVWALKAHPQDVELQAGHPSSVVEIILTFMLATEANLDLVLQRFVQHQLHVTSGAIPRATGSGVIQAEGLAQYFGKSASIR
jgi:hypothetical protein